ncbi:MAG: PIF1 family DEAD/DEAH box helicase [Patescibacteria group bacterium]
MKQKDALEILKMGYNVYLTGAAGSGKTYLLNKYIEYLRGNNIPVAVTASTGIAATHMNGRTVHSWCGMGINMKMNKSQISELADKDYIYSNITNTKVLIIDEISMLHASQLDLVNNICKNLRDNDIPFGGMQVILCGDFFQLPPVSKGNDLGKFITESDIWSEMDLKVCYLSEQYRQDDHQFIKILKNVRANQVDQEALKLLKSRINAEIKTDLQITKLYSHNIDVDRINDMELNKISQEPKEFEMHSEGKNQKIIETLKGSCLAPEKLILKKGAMVMFVRNNFSNGYVNGTLGKVINFDDDTGCPIIKTFKGDRIIAYPETWKIEENYNVLAQISQIPLRLAWAITIHKSQGMSLDVAEIDLSKSFAYGMGYVALSRVKSLSGIILKGLNDMALKIDENILRIDKDLMEMSQNFLKEYLCMSKKGIKQIQDNFIKENAEIPGDCENEYCDCDEVKLEDIPF